MKKKFICRLSAMLIAVLCVCLLCIPAFASDETMILPETTFVFDFESGTAILEYELPFVIGDRYKVTWNGVSYFMLCSSQELDPGEFIIGLYPNDLENFDIPFFIILTEGFTLFVPLSEDSISQDGTFTVAIYGASSSSAPTNRNYIQTPVIIPASGLYVGTYTTQLIEGETYTVSVNGSEYELICEYYKDMDIAGNRLTDNKSFQYLQAENSNSCFIIAPAGVEFAVYQSVDMSKVIFSNITTYADSLRIQLSSTSVIEVLAYIAGACVLGVFLWWGVRKAVKGIKSAYLRGKLRF